MLHAPAEPRVSTALAIGLPSCSLEQAGNAKTILSSPCYETMSLQTGLVGRDGAFIPFKANARHIRNVKQSVTDFIGPL